MFTNYLYQIFKNNLQILAFFDFLRDALLFLIIIIPIILSISEVVQKKKFNKFFLLELALTIIFSFFLTAIIKTYYPELRPISYFHPGEQYLDSFPSRHTALAAGISNVVLNNYLEWGIFLYLLTALVTIFSWLSLQHWLIDIIFGFLLGYFISVLVLDFVKLLLRFYVKKGK